MDAQKDALRPRQGFRRVLLRCLHYRKLGKIVNKLLHFSKDFVHPHGVNNASWSYAYAVLILKVLIESAYSFFTREHCKTRTGASPAVFKFVQSSLIDGRFMHRWR